uniref:DUF834 domain-containing protein n=1 Tax=Oryza meridionalis TaxID=40149 RepID=A0A0E0EXP5_9ORYZ
MVYRGTNRMPPKTHTCPLPVFFRLSSSPSPAAPPLPSALPSRRHCLSPPSLWRCHQEGDELELPSTSLALIDAGTADGGAGGGDRCDDNRKSTAEVGIDVAADRCSGAQGAQVAGPEVADRWRTELPK